MIIPVVLIGGPTAAGKTRLAVMIAKEFGGELISADSRQIYKGADIGTAKDKSFPQRLVDIKNIGEPYSVAEFQKDALREIEDISAKGKLPIIVGGTGYYLDSLLYKKEYPKIQDLELRKKLAKKTLKELERQLESLDEMSFERVKGNKRRLIRALEIVLKTNKAVPKQKNIPRFEDAVTIVLDPGKEVVDLSIEKRFNLWLEKGLVKEAESIVKESSLEELRKLGLEYAVLADYLEGKIDFSQMVKLSVKAIKRYSRRQRSWWRRCKEAVWVKDAGQGFLFAKKVLKVYNR